MYTVICSFATFRSPSRQQFSLSKKKGVYGWAFGPFYDQNGPKAGHGVTRGDVFCLCCTYFSWTTPELVWNYAETHCVWSAQRFKCKRSHIIKHKHNWMNNHTRVCFNLTKPAKCEHTLIITLPFLKRHTPNNVSICFLCSHLTSV